MSQLNKSMRISSRLRSDVTSWTALNILTPGVCSSTGEYSFHTPNGRVSLHYAVHEYLISQWVYNNIVPQLYLNFCVPSTLYYGKSSALVECVLVKKGWLAQQ